MNYHARVSHTWSSNRPNSNLSSSYRYRVNGGTHTLSGTGSQRVSITRTHRLGLIGVNDPDYNPNISHVSASSTGTANNGQNVSCN